MGKVKRAKCEAKGCEVADASVKKHAGKYYCSKHAPKVKGPILRIPKDK